MFRDQFWEFAKFEGGMAAKQLSFEELKDINYETIAIHLDSEENHLLVISFTRSNRMNSFIPKQYQELSFVLYQVANIPSVHAVLLRGEGKFYSSGHDLSYQMKEMSNHQGGVTKELMIEIIEKNASSLVKSLIDFDKPIIAACHGPAFGIAATTLALCDIVYASEKAIFQTPFMKFAFCAEGCSSYLFPQIMGYSKANELLLLGKPMNAKEAKECNFVSDVFPLETFSEEVLKRARTVASYPPNALINTKQLVKTKEVKEFLHNVNRKELECLADRFMSEECIQAVAAFFMERQKSKL